jgi:hypothetical protein
MAAARNNIGNRLTVNPMVERPGGGGGSGTVLDLCDDDG